MNLSPNFALSEMIESQVAVRRGIPNVPNDGQIIALKALCANVLEPARALLGIPIVITSGFRSSSLNRLVGGNVRSQHMAGEAADLHALGVPNLDAIRRVIGSTIPWDQLILEFPTALDPSSGWIHVSFTAERKNRREVYTATRSTDGKVSYIPGLA